MATFLTILIVYLYASICIHTLMGEWTHFDIKEFGMALLWPFYPIMRIFDWI